ncbi:hypothetical protein [Natrinema longum]|uniref:Uncharacterized protein n=1 Tax=Natrinema longum TaxID=370324 RepID=A0A8A2UC47_9EURY|nr:hypothetical protein [Natrinema longum]MBZ6495742.1 hypothetical protein [Natrinema longum]QSW86299.1 hypothetical protein J0X27_05640 [Natrinema longum]
MGQGSATLGQVRSNDFEPQCGGGGQSNPHVRDSSVKSNFPNGEGKMFSSAGSAYGQTSDIVWTGEHWTVDFHTWSFAVNSYELDSGETGTEPIYRGQHRIQVDMETKPDLVSTQPYDDVEWGISIVGRSEASHKVDEAVVSTANKILSNMTEGVGSVVDAIGIYNRLQKATVGADIDKTWVPSQGQQRLGHYLRWTHTYPPQDELGESSITGAITNKLSNALYKTEVEWTGDREPTERYEHTYNYYVPVGPKPTSLSQKASKKNLIEKRPAKEVNNDNIEASGDEEVYVLRPEAFNQPNNVC